jgi:hypothetical protein
MKYLFAAVLVASSFASFSADAAGGCGPGRHRGPYGGCAINRGAVYVAPRAVVVERPPVVVVRPGRVCGRGFAWRYGRCRPF